MRAGDQFAGTAHEHRPWTPTEEAVASVWAEVLKLDHVALDDKFFDLGGHSLLAMRAVIRLRNILDIEAPLRTFFDGPTVAQFAAILDRLLEARAAMEGGADALEYGEL